MKLVFREVGLRKISKIVEVSQIPDYKNVIEFATTEIQPYMPPKGRFEFIPTDGLPELLAGQYVIVYTDTNFVSRSMGVVLVYA